MTDAPTHPARSHRERDALIEEHLHLTRFVASEMKSRVPSHVAWEELQSAAAVALVQSAERYDPALGATFSSFALPRLRGAVLDDLRSRDWASRSVRTLARQVDRATDELAARLGRPPTRAELAEHLDVPVDRIEHVHADVHRAVVVGGFDATLHADQVVGRTGRSPEEELVRREGASYLMDAVAALPEQVREVVERSFFAEETLQQIADDLGLSLSRVSKIRTQGLSMIHRVLQEVAREAPAGPVGGVRAERQYRAYADAVAQRSRFEQRIDASVGLEGTHFAMA